MTTAAGTASRGGTIRSLSRRLARLEAGRGQARCPDHELRIRITGDVGAATLDQALPPCRRCGRPVDEFVVEITCVPDREAPPL